MTLRQQFSFLTGSLVLTLLVGTLVLAIISGKEHYQDQMNASAFDAATSLALSMSNSDTDAERERQIDVLFDRGFYKEIVYEGISSKQLKRKEIRALSNPAPAWFMALFDFELYPAVADVTDGWRRLGVVSVTSHTDFAYKGLWDLAKIEVLWFIIVLFIALILVNILTGWLFRPVEGVEQQAIAISEKKWVKQSELPKVRELRNMVVAMNIMVDKVHAMFSEQARITERLRKDSFVDSVTGVLNRRGFDQKFEYFLTSLEEHSLLLVLVHLEDFSSFNREFGRSHADKLLVDVANSIAGWSEEYASGIMGRHAGVDFSVLIGVSSRDQAISSLDDLFRHMSMDHRISGKGLIFRAGGAYLASSQDTLKESFSKADLALKQAAMNRELYSLYSDVESELKEYTASEWRNILIGAIDDEKLDLVGFPLYSKKENGTSIELYSRLINDGDIISGAKFWPMVEFHGLSSIYDLHVIGSILEWLAKDDARLIYRFSINISPGSLKKEDFLSSLKTVFSKYPAEARHISLEFPESAILSYEKEIKNIVLGLKFVGLTIGIDQVGTGGVPFSYMKRVMPDYLRIDGALNRGVSECSDQLFFVQFLVQMGHQLGIDVYADAVESKDDKLVLDDIAIDGLSGYVCGAPLRVVELLN